MVKAEHASHHVDRRTRFAATNLDFVPTADRRVTQRKSDPGCACTTRRERARARVSASDVVLCRIVNRRGSRG